MIAMSSLESELQDLREKNNELVKKMQYWKITAAQRENEKIELMKEINELRLKLSRLRSGGAAQTRKLDVEIQSAGEKAISHLVQASNAVARTVQLVKTFMTDSQELQTTLPRWSSISNTPNREKVHRVPPMMIGGQSIQPVVSLSRTMVNLNNLRTNPNPNNNQNRSFPERAVPMHVLQDLYIPLTRIDANDLPVNNMDTETEDNSAEDLGLDDSAEQALQESQNVSETDVFDNTPGLDVVTEELEPEDVEHATPSSRSDNPLEGPSWMLDGSNKGLKDKSRINLEPDSTTEFDKARNSPVPGPGHTNKKGNLSGLNCERARPAATCEFSPTVRRRKRTSSPPPASPLLARSSVAFSPRPRARRNSSTSGRILKVLVSKLRLDEDGATPPKRPSVDGSPKGQNDSPPRRQSSDGSPDKRQSNGASSAVLSRDTSPAVPLSRDARLLSFDAPSPNGATTSHVIVSESTIPMESDGSGEPAAVVAHKIDKRGKRTSRDRLEACDARHSKSEGRTSRDTSRDTGRDSRASRDSDSGSGGDAAPDGRARRARRAVTYKEKPLNRKMRR